MLALDPVQDAHEIYRWHATIEFPWDVTRALELALYRTYAVPSIGGLLDQTGEFAQRAQKRYDDTALLLAEVLEHGFDSARGRAAIARINRIHARFDISAEDMRYVLAVFVVTPLRWLDRFGWRPVTTVEREAACGYYRQLGARMGIRDLPESWPDFCALADSYEIAHFQYTPANARIGTATRELFVRWFWFVPGPVVRLGVHALLDPSVRSAFGFPDPPPVAVRGADLALRLRGRLVAVLPKRRTPFHTRDSWLVRSYPGGYEIGELGPPGLPS